MSVNQNPHNIPFPAFARWRLSPWLYVGWGPNPPAVESGSYADVKRKALISDHGERRELDEYPEGFACWMLE
jgi:hypothetical protein